MATNPSASRWEFLILSTGSFGSQGLNSRRLQEWLSFHGCATKIDERFGVATEKTPNGFQSKNNLPVTSKLTKVRWESLVAPLGRTISALPTTQNRVSSILAVAKAHLAENPVELGGEHQ